METGFLITQMSLPFINNSLESTIVETWGKIHIYMYIYMLVNVWDQMHLYGKKCIIEVHSQKVHSVTPYFYFFLTPYFFKKRKGLILSHTHTKRKAIRLIFSLTHLLFICAERSFIFVNV